MKFKVEKDDKRYSYPVFSITIKDEDDNTVSRLEMKFTNLNEDEVQDLVDQINKATGIDLG